MTEYVEWCPYCEHENHIRNWDVGEKGFVITCESCGHQLLLCDACPEVREGKLVHYCDWQSRTENHVETGHCRRGGTVNRVDWESV